MRVLSIDNEFIWNLTTLVIINAKFTTRKTYSICLHLANDAPKCNEWMGKPFHNVFDLTQNKVSAFDFLYLIFKEEQ